MDIEDWFHILDVPSIPKISEWDYLPSNIEKNFKKLLDVFSKKNVHVTCFVLGWVAEKFPNLIKEARDRGHEIASHGYSHKLVYEMTEHEFFQDAIKSKDIIENITGRQILGYRSAGFSITENTSWFFDQLIRAGYRYDSSVFPGPRGHGGLKTNHYAPYLIRNSLGKIIEFPITVSEVFGKPFCFFGGGYLRLSPYFLIRKMALNVLKEKRPVIFYIHPREIDAKHPRLPMSFKRKFKSYVNLKTTEKKVKKVLNEFNFTTFESFIAKNKELLE